METQSAVIKKNQESAFCGGFNVCSKMLAIFSQSVVVSEFLFAVVCWGAESELTLLLAIVGHKLDSFIEVTERRTGNNLLPIVDSPEHPLYHQQGKAQCFFSNRLVKLCCHKDRHRKPFIP